MKLSSKKGAIMPIVIILMASLVIVTTATLVMANTYSKLTQKRIEELREEVKTSDQNYLLGGTK